MPSVVFYTAARKAFARLGLAPTEPALENFVASRTTAERTARRQTAAEEVTLDDIWRILLPSLGWKDASLINCEMEAEAEGLAPVPAVADLIKIARQHGNRIIFVSDMYLPRAFLEKQLKQSGLAEGGDGIYVSSEIGKSKATGNLFRHVLAQEKIKPSELHHLGDHRSSDFAIPRKLGIKAELFTLAQPTAHEGNLLAETGASRPAAQAVAGAMRAFRLQSRENRDADVDELVSQFLGPMALGFAAWALAEAQRNGIRRLYFLSRDCQLVSHVAQQLASDFGGVECRYLYVSRQALFLPSAGAINPQGMPWMRRDFEWPTLERLLSKLELRFADVLPKLASLAGPERELYRLNSPADWDHFWGALNEDPLKTRILNLISTRRHAAVEYFKAEGLMDGTPWAIVDLGWFLTCQSSLWKLLQSAGWRGTIRGLYLGLATDRLGPALAGDATGLFYGQPPAVPGNPSPDVFTYATLLERVFGCADHPMVHRYEFTQAKGAYPAFKPDAEEYSYASGVSLAIRTRVVEFAKANLHLARALSDPRDVHEVMARLVAGFGTSPTRQMAQAVFRLSSSGNQNRFDVNAIVRPLNLATALLPIFPGIGPLGNLWRHRNCVWAEGAHALTPPTIMHLETSTQRLAAFRRKIARSVFR